MGLRKRGREGGGRGNNDRCERRHKEDKEEGGGEPHRALKAWTIDRTRRAPPVQLCTCPTRTSVLRDPETQIVSRRVPNQALIMPIPKVRQTDHVKKEPLEMTSLFALNNLSNYLVVPESVFSICRR